MEALRKMTIEPARRLESYVAVMKSKGRLEAGADADITIFDATTVIDRSTYIDPTIPSYGIEFVLVHPGDPPALPGRHPKFDNSGNLIATPKREPPSNTLRRNYETSRQFKSQPVGV